VKENILKIEILIVKINQNSRKTILKTAFNDIVQKTCSINANEPSRPRSRCQVNSSANRCCSTTSAATGGTAAS